MRRSTRSSDKLTLVDPQFRQQIKEIMNICAVTPEQAYESLVLNDFSLEKSIAFLLENGQSSKTIQNVHPPTSKNEDSFSAPFGDFDDSDQQYEPYFYYENQENAKKYFYQHYPVPIALLTNRGQSQKHQLKDDLLFPKLEKLVKVPEKALKSSVSSLSQAFCISYCDKIPVLILNTNLSKEASTIIGQLLDNQPNIKNKIERQFIYFGLLSNQYKVQKWLRPFLDLKALSNSFLILRVNLYDTIEIVKQISLVQPISSIVEQLKRAKAETVRATLDQKYIKLKHKMSKEGKFWRRPTSFKHNSKRKKEQKMLLSNQRIRREQEEAYHQLAGEAEKQLKQKKKQEEIEESLTAEYKKMLNKKRAGLMSYSEGMPFKIRVPSGDNLLVFAPKDEHIQYLYDVIECKQEDLGFQKKIPRKFDLVVPFVEGMNMRDKRDLSIGAVFSEPAALVVREVD